MHKHSKNVEYYKYSQYNKNLRKKHSWNLLTEQRLGEVTSEVKPQHYGYGLIMDQAAQGGRREGKKKPKYWLG